MICDVDAENGWAVSGRYEMHHIATNKRNGK